MDNFATVLLYKKVAYSSDLFQVRAIGFWCLPFFDAFLNQRGLLVQFILQVRNNTVSALCMVLGVDILHHFTIGNWIVSLPHIATIAFVESIAQKSHHSGADSFLILRVPFNPPVVYCSQNGQHQNTLLLHPILANRFPNHIPIHKASFPSFFIPQPMPSTAQEHSEAPILLEQYALAGKNRGSHLHRDKLPHRQPYSRRLFARCVNPDAGIHSRCGG